MKELLLTQLDRQTILWFYSKAKANGKTWAYFNKPAIVTRFEQLKANQKFCKEIRCSGLFKLLFR